MTEIKLDPKLRKTVAEALEPYARSMFSQQTGTWTAVVTFSHGCRTEEVKTDPEEGVEFLARAVKLRVLDAEIVTGAHEEQAMKAQEAARHERQTVGTLLEDFPDAGGS